MDESKDVKKIIPEPIKVRWGNQLYWARRLSSGNWRIDDLKGYAVRTVSNGEFQAQFEKVPDDHKTRPTA